MLVSGILTAFNLAAIILSVTAGYKSVNPRAGVNNTAFVTRLLIFGYVAWLPAAFSMMAQQRSQSYRSSDLDAFLLALVSPLMLVILTVLLGMALGMPVRLYRKWRGR